MTQRVRRFLVLVASALVMAGCAGDGWYTPRTIELTNGGLWGVAGQDSDGDGIPDSLEGGDGVDTDGDGIPDYLDTDSDNDGTPDADEGTGDDDGDGIPNWIDDDDSTGDDDDSTGDDDDSTGDDDDSTGDDDDSTGDDDDSTGGDDDDDDSTAGDDDDSVGDDDDSVGPAILTMSASVQDFGTVSPGTQGIATVTLENTGGTSAFVNLTLSVTLAGSNLVWEITGGTPVLAVPPASTRTRFVQFTPPAGLPAAAYSTELEAEDTDTLDVLSLVFTADTGAAGETECADTIDNDADLLIDCDDPDCGADPVCNPNADFCCFAGGGPITSTQCQETNTVVQCVCNADAWCCDQTNGGWDQTCVDSYVICGATCN